MYLLRHSTEVGDSTEVCSRVGWPWVINIYVICEKSGLCSLCWSSCQAINLRQKTNKQTNPTALQTLTSWGWGTTPPPLLVTTQNFSFSLWISQASCPEMVLLHQVLSCVDLIAAVDCKKCYLKRDKEVILASCTLLWRHHYWNYSQCVHHVRNTCSSIYADYLGVN